MTEEAGGDSASKSSLSETLRAAGDEIKEKLAESAGSAGEMASEKLRALGQAAEEVASHSAERIQEEMGKKQNVGADFAVRIANNIREAARAFEVDTPMAGRTVLAAADYVEEAARKFRDGSISDVVDGMTTFAKRQPVALLGLSALAGFAVVRFLKASAASGKGSTVPLPGAMSQTAWSPPRQQPVTTGSKSPSPIDA